MANWVNDPNTYPSTGHSSFVWDTVALDWVKMTQPGGTGGGGGTQYAQGTTNATPTGTVAMAKNPSNVLGALSTDASGNLNVNLAAGSISGGNTAASATGAAVPANAGYTGFNSAGNLVGVSSANPLPVAQQGSVAVTGTFWQATQPVSGTFWQTTQPVSLTSLPALAAGANTIGAVNVNGTVPVSGTFWQATQPVSIATMPTTPVTGTFWQATQPVSIATMPTTPVKPDGTTWGITGTSANVYIGNPVSVLPTYTTGTIPPGSASIFNIGYALGGTNNAWSQVVGNGTPGGLPIQNDGSVLKVQVASGQSVSVQETLQQSLTLPTLQAILTELRVMNAMLQIGLNVKDDPEDFRADPFYNNSTAVQ